MCFSESHVTLSELKKVSADIEQRCAGDVNLETIDWIWKRLAETGPVQRLGRNGFRQINNAGGDDWPS